MVLSAGVDESLLKTTVLAETVLVSDGPAIAHDLLLGDAWKAESRLALARRSSTACKSHSPTSAQSLITSGWLRTTSSDSTSSSMVMAG